MNDVQHCTVFTDLDCILHNILRRYLASYPLRLLKKDLLATRRLLVATTHSVQRGYLALFWLVELCNLFRHMMLEDPFVLPTMLVQSEGLMRMMMTTLSFAVHHLCLFIITTRSNSIKFLV